MSGWCRVQQPATAEMNSRYLWPMSTMPLRWSIERAPEEFSGDQYIDIVRNSFAVWEAVCGLQVEQSDSRPNLVFTTRQIDRQNGVLAEAMLPAGNLTKRTTLTMWMDVGEHWANYKGGLNGQMMDVTRVMIHEIGHWLGITHVNYAKAIMNPSVSEVRSLLGPDVQEAVERYGKAKPDVPADGDSRDCLSRIFTPEALKAGRALQKAAPIAWKLFQKYANK